MAEACSVGLLIFPRDSETLTDLSAREFDSKACKAIWDFHGD
jgi:hypothetical protein